MYHHPGTFEDEQKEAEHSREIAKLKKRIGDLEELICRASPIMWAMTGDDASAGRWEKEAEQAIKS